MEISLEFPTPPNPQLHLLPCCRHSTGVCASVLPCRRRVVVPPATLFVLLILIVKFHNSRNLPVLISHSWINLTSGYGLRTITPPQASKVNMKPMVIEGV
ncbi:hypothetical protein L3X38_029280 [Prunus dulcis]|uniref:Uncharacterized protein n=1 Tax=Prunus dulcis TaxID=3755 RepID=A0AAD4VRK2_PRUDU|nr:hypothetical protein L3X38_029280 [Prunus dulcis]